MTTQKLPRRSRATTAKVDAGRLGKLLRLALSSDQPGEITAAVGALRRDMCAAGIDLHQLADAAERGLRPAPVRQPQTSGPPVPSPNDWSAMCWFLHYHRHHLRTDQAEFVADLLLGVGFEDDGRIREWQLEELRALVARVVATRCTEVRR